MRRWAFGSARRSIWPCGRRAARSPRPSGWRRARSRTWSRCGWASRRRSSRFGARLEYYPGLRFKLDPTGSWTPALVEELAATGAVGDARPQGRVSRHARRQPARRQPLPARGRRLPRCLDRGSRPRVSRSRRGPGPVPGRDAGLGTGDLLQRRRCRGTAVPAQDAEREAFALRLRSASSSPPTTTRRANGIGVYGGGQFELGPGRGQIEYLASMFGPEHPNDVARSASMPARPGPAWSPARSHPRSTRPALPLGLIAGSRRLARLGTLRAGRCWSSGSSRGR